MGVDYRAVARHLAAQRAVRPSQLCLRCDGCGTTLTADVPYWERDARQGLVQRALDDGWDIDSQARIACAACVAKAAAEE